MIQPIDWNCRYFLLSKDKQLNLSEFQEFTKLQKNQSNEIIEKKS